MRLFFSLRSITRWKPIYSKIGKAMYKALDTLLCLAIVLMVSPVFFTVFTLRNLAFIAARVKYGRDARLMEAQETFALSEALESFIYFAIEVDGHIELKQLQERCQRNLTDLRLPNGQYQHPKLRSYIEVLWGYGVYRWEEDFDINRHVLPVLDSTTGQTKVFTSKEEAYKVIQSLRDGTHLPFEEKTSRWRIHLMYYKNPSAISLDVTAVTSVIVVEVPHSMCDGYSAANIFTDALMDRQPGEEATERRICPSAGPSLSFFQGLWLRINGIIHMLPVLEHLDIVKMEYKNPYDNTRMVRRSRVREWGQDPGTTRTVFNPPPIFIPLEILADIRNATGVNTFSVSICAYLRGLAKYWMKERMHSGEDPDSWKEWIFSIVVPVSLWDPKEPLRLANNVAVCRPMFKCSEFMNDNLAEAMKYVKTNLFEQVAKTTWSVWALTRVFASNMPKPMIDMYSSITTDFPFTASIQTLRLSPKWKNMKVFKRDVLLIQFQPNVTRGQDLGGGVLFFDGFMAAFALFASSMIVDNEAEVNTMHQMIKEEVLQMHATLVPSKPINFHQMTKELIPPQAFFMGAQAEADDHDGVGNSAASTTRTNKLIPVEASHFRPKIVLG